MRQIAECKPDFGNGLDQALPHIKTCQKFIMKNGMPFLLLLDEKICFIRLPPYTLQNFWQVITVV
jgi:hypothetical protein